MKTLESIILENLFKEARRNPDKNPRTSTIDLVLKYKDDPDMYMTFTGVDYAGIYPRYIFR
jgi:hypothetical protein